jgi:hypothetical protein
MATVGRWDLTWRLKGYTKTDKMCDKMQSFLILRYLVLINTTRLQKLEWLDWPGIHCPQWKGKSNATTGPPPEPGESSPQLHFFCRASTRLQVMTSPCGPSPSLPGTPHSEGLVWTSDQTDAEASTWQQTILTRDRYPCPRRDSSPQSQKASARRPTS